MSPRLVVFATLFSLAACNNQQEAGDLYDGPAMGRVAGFVTDTQGQPLSDVTVEIDGLYTVTDAEGRYVLEAVEPGQDLVVEFYGEGFAKGYARTNLISWETVSVDKALLEVNGYGQFDSEAGGTVSVDGVHVTFQPSSIMYEDGTHYTGTVNVAVTYVDPYSDDLMAAPADLAALAFGDGAAKDANTPVQLISYGMTDITLTDEDGEPLQLEEGEAAEVDMPITNGELPEVYRLIGGDTQKTWSFDGPRGRWIEEGVGQVQEVENEETGEMEMRFVFEATHFSWWNCDQGPQPTCASGRVVDDIGFPVRGASVIARGGMSTSVVTTDEDGYWVANVMTGDTVTFTARTYVGRQNWEAAETKYIDGEGSNASVCEPIDEINIPVCREAGVIMAEDLNLHVSGLDAGQNGDQLRAWFWEPSGDPINCQQPWDRLDEDECMETTPEDFPSHLADDLPISVEIPTKSAGEWVEFTTPRDRYRLDKDEENGRPEYWYETVEVTDEGNIVVHDLDLRGGDAVDARAPGNPSDYFGPMDEDNIIIIPDEVNLSGVNGALGDHSRSAGMDINYNGAGNEYGMLVWVTKGPSDTCLVCRYGDDGNIRISGNDLGAMDPGYATISVFRPDFEWTPGPDGLPIRKQVLSGAIVETNLR
ncbi:MAG: carboxypeptidase regulatory-like domain-containing protein [Alphaproteobacteria bacterium]|nr:carboxypeptidase regulatory-like domain-containing protein [Alphaproteobacteria bacterium]MCB9795966.1 carboxypeptidase regulatory-like domain-containing protein [Alphaproteobacteria bacterium]